MSEYFPEPKFSEDKVKVKLDLSNYATKGDFKSATGVDASQFHKKLDLANLESNVESDIPSGSGSLKGNVDKLDIRKLETTPVDLTKLSNVVKNNVVKKTESNAKIKVLKIKCQILQTQLLKLLLVLK